MTNYQKRFYRGDIAELVPYIASENTRLEKIRKVLYQTHAYKLIVLRPLDDNMYLVVVCKKHDKRTHLKLETNKEPLYVKALQFFAIDGESLMLCAELYFKKNKIQVVEEIYATHNYIVETRKKARIEKVRQNREKQRLKKKNLEREKKTQRKRENKYIQLYEIAIINNDTKTMKEIEKIIGYSPGFKGLNAKSRQNGIAYSNINPRPFSGGGFTPK